MSPDAQPTRRHLSDPEKIKALRPHFDNLRETALEILSQLDPYMRVLLQNDVFINVRYRLPDKPDVISPNLFLLNQTDYAVPIEVPEKSNDPDHKIYDMIAPRRKFGDLDEDEPLYRFFLFKGIRTGMSPPETIRVVLPETMGFISMWIQKIEGPLHSVRYSTRPAPAAHFDPKSLLSVVPRGTA